MHTNPFSSLKNILAIRLDNIGDVVMTGPAIRALRQANPGAKITMMASPGGSQVTPLLPWVDDVIAWRAVWQDISKDVPVTPEKELELVQLLAERAFDAAFIFTSFSQSPYPPAYACYMARIPLRVGQSKEFGGGLLSHWVKPLEEPTYQVDRNLHLLRGLDIPVADDRLELRVPPAAQHSVEALLAESGIGPQQPYVALAPGASAKARRYDEERFAAAVEQISEQARLPVVLIGSPREVGKFPTLETLATLTYHVHSLIGRTSVVEMGGIIQRSALVITNNSGSLHMAAAFNRPLVALYSGTETLEQWAPRTRALEILNRPTHCSPCYNFECPYQMECLDIPPEAVATAALRLLSAPANLPALAKTSALQHGGNE
jgi:lipopolysaccharide heptosyltransferase II